MKRLYNIDQYDENLCLRPGIKLILIVLFLSRNLLLPFIVFAVGKNMNGNVNYLLDISNQGAISFISSCPAVVIIFAWTRRRPDAQRLTKIIWKSGRWLLSLSALLDILFRVYIEQGWINDIALSYIVLNTCIILSLIFSTRIKDVFNDFPQKQ